MYSWRPTKLSNSARDRQVQHVRIQSLRKLFTFWSLYKLLFTSWLFIVVSKANKHFKKVQNCLQTTLEQQTWWNQTSLHCPPLHWSSITENIGFKAELTFSSSSAKVDFTDITISILEKSQSPKAMSTLYRIVCVSTQKAYRIGLLFTKGSLIFARSLQRSDAAPLRSSKWILTYRIAFRTTLSHRVNRFPTAAEVNNLERELHSTIWRPCHLCWFLLSRTLYSVYSSVSWI